MSASNGGEHKHHILSNSTSRNVLFFLLVFTLLTVVIAMFDFGNLNFLVAMIIATVKAMAVMLFFMGLKYDNNENRVIFFGSFAFLAIFIFYTTVDVFQRDPSRKVEGSIYLQTEAAAKTPEFTKPWEPNEAVQAYGKQLFQEQACYTCHGEEGKGDGPAGIALKARNFHEEAGWKNGRKITQIYTTLTKGLNSMPAFANLQPVQKLALAQYVQHWGPPPASPTAEELKAIGINPDLPDGGLNSPQEKKLSLPIDFAMERYVNGH